MTAIQRALRWLRAVLSAGPLPVVEIEKLAREASIARRTLRRARAKLGVRSWPVGFGGPHALALPEHADGEIPEPAQTGPAPDHVEPVSPRDRDEALHDDEHGDDRRPRPRDPPARRVLRRIR